MVNIRIIIFILLLTFVSCRQKTTSEYEKSIIGEWTMVKEEIKKQNSEEPPPPPSPMGKFVSGYTFLPNNICEYKLGFFKRIVDGRLFLGTTTKYKIEEDSLKIFNRSDSLWTSLKIVSITADTMTLQWNDTTAVKYSKADYRIDKSEHYDEIIISASGCYGTCPINNISINRNGPVIYFGEEYNTVNGLYQSQINSTLFSKLEEDFKKANIKNLQDRYEDEWTDGETVSVTFIKDNKIVKSISDYRAQSPTEFYWAYTSGTIFISADFS